MKYLIVITLLIVGCNKAGVRNKSISVSPYAFTCEEVRHLIERCENKEVVCYVSKYNAKSSQCKFK